MYYLNNRFKWVAYSIVNNRVNRNCHRVFGQYFLWRYIKGNCAQVDLAVVVDTGQYKEHSWAASTARPRIVHTYVFISMNSKLMFHKTFLILNIIWTKLYLSRPIRKITALSYSATTLKHTNNENGIVIIISTTEASIANTSMQPMLSPSASFVLIKQTNIHVYIFIDLLFINH